MELAGRAAIVTGGGRGIGRGIALALAEAGADVAINYRRDEAAAKEVVKQIEGFGRRAFSAQCDVTDADAVNAMVAAVDAAFGKLDLLVSNAGIASRGQLLADTEVSEMRRVIDTHVFGAFHFFQAALPRLRKNERSDVIVISSVSPHRTPPGHGPYAVAKAGLEAMAKVLAKEERRHGMRVNIIAAGVVETDLGRRLVKFNMGDELENVVSQFPFGRACQPEDVANLCVFLASDKGSYITGHTIFLDGGDGIGAMKQG